MRKIRFSPLPFLLVCGLLGACLAGPRLTVIYDDAHGLKPDDRVLWKEHTIGRVQSIAPNGTGRVAVRLQINRDYREKVIEESRFLIRADLQGQGESYVEMINLTEEGNPVPDGTEIEGSTYFSLQLERGQRELKAWSKLLEQEFERWEKELSQLPETEWYKELERQMDYWLNELAQAGAETRRYFREEILPHLEEAMRQLRKRLRELGKEKEVEILEIKLEKLKNI